MLLGSKSLPLAKYYRILKITKNQFDLYAQALSQISLRVKTSNNIIEKKLLVNATQFSINSLDNKNIGSLVYTTDDNFIYLFLKPLNTNRSIFVECDIENIVANFDTEVKSYEDEELDTATEVTNYIDISGSSFVTQDATGRYSVKLIQNDIISVNLVITIAENLTAGNRTLVSALNMPSKTAFVIHGATTDGKHISVQYNNSRNLVIPSSVGDIEAGTYYVNGVIN